MDLSTFRAKSPTDLLACVPTLLGFHPEDSVVMVTTGRAAEPVHARVDLPGRPGRAGVVASIVAELRDVVAGHGVEEVALVLYTADPELADDVGSALTAALAGEGVEVALVLRTDGTRWFAHDDDGTSRPMAPGVPYDLTHHPLTVQAVVAGRVVHGSRAALRRSLEPAPAAAVAAVTLAVDQHCDRLLASVPGDRGAADRGLVGYQAVEERWVRHRVCRFLLDRRALDADDAGRLLVAIVSVRVRDVAWAQMSRDNARSHVDLWRDLVRRSPDEVVAAPAALLAFAAWLSGDGALAWCAVERCQAAQPDYSMASLVAQALAGAVPPSSWTPMADAASPSHAE